MSCPAVPAAFPFGFALFFSLKADRGEKWGQIKIICSRLPRIRIQPFQYFKLHSYPRKPVMRWSLFHP